MMCQFRFTNYNKRITLVEDVDMGEAVHVWGQRVNGDSLCPLNFVVNFKLLSTDKILTKNLDSNQRLLTNTKIGNMRSSLEEKSVSRMVLGTVIPTFKEFTIQLWNQYLYIWKGY